MASSGDRQTLSANGTTTFKKYIGPVVVSLTGTFGSGTAKIQKKDPSDAIVDIAGSSFTLATDTIFDFPKDQTNDLAVNLTGATGPSLVIVVQGRPEF